MIRAALFVVLASELEAQNWPQFRGPDGSGIADRQSLPLEWSVAEGRKLLWRVPMEGLAHSSPIVWGDRVYLTTAVADTTAEPTLVLGDSDVAGIDTAPDMVAHRWELLALDKRTGDVLWRKTAHRGVPRLTAKGLVHRRLRSREREGSLARGSRGEARLEHSRGIPWRGRGRARHQRR